MADSQTTEEKKETASDATQETADREPVQIGELINQLMEGMAKQATELTAIGARIDGLSQAIGEALANGVANQEAEDAETEHDDGDGKDDERDISDVEALDLNIDDLE